MNYEYVDAAMQQNVENADQVNDRVGTIQDMCEFVYAGRQMAIMNQI